MKRTSTHPTPTLANVPAGTRARILQFGHDIPLERLEHLLVFGISPGRWVEIKQQQPITVVQVDYTELALENEVAEQIAVTDLTPIHISPHHPRRGFAGRRHPRRDFFQRRMGRFPGMRRLLRRKGRDHRQED
jgi:Fe2+ transport system protein FeoA